LMKRKRLSLEKEKSIHRSIYQYTKVNSLSYTKVNQYSTGLFVSYSAHGKTQLY